MTLVHWSVWFTAACTGTLSAQEQSETASVFEAILSVCLAVGDAPCRDVLVPGYEAADLAGCQAALAADPPGEGAECRPAGSALAFTELAPGVFVHRGQIAEPDRANGGDVSNIGFVIGDRSVAVIDSGSARWMGEGIWRAIRARTELPVSHVILTHMHPDHVFGAGVFVEAGAQVVGHEALSRALADRRDNYRESLAALIGPGPFIGTDIVATDMTVAVGDSLSVDLGGSVLDLRAWPLAHTGTDLTVMVMRTGLLFTGDLVFDDHIPALDGSLRGWQSVLDDLTGMEATQIVPGHGGPVLDWPDGADAVKRYLAVLARDAKAAIDRGDRLGDAIDEIAQGESGHWSLFDAFNARNATVAYTELEWE